MATQQDQLHEPAPPTPPVASKAAQLIEFEEFIEAQLRKTRSHVRSVDISGSLMLLAAGSLAYFLVAALVDHWVVAGGLGYWGRALFLATYLVGAAIFVATQVAPLLFRSINPVYAAETIERSRPSLKNGLVNFLFFRANPAGMSAQVYEAVEEQAATRLAESHADAAVDRTRLITVSYGLAGVLLLCALYTLASPKDFLKSIGRIAMPWAEISAPTRTAIVEIEPRGAQAFRGQQVDVSARVQGLADSGKVMLYYSTADGQIVDRAVEMVLAADGYKHACTLPAGDSSLQQSLEYRIEAGDAISPRFKLEVVAAPTIVVESVEYKYPAYTGLLAQRVEHQGDLKAIEGTQITIHALANAAIQSAQVDFDCDDQHDQRMQIEGDKATTAFRLKLKDDRQTPEHTSYRLVFKNEQGQQNPQPVRHEIEVTRDLSPEVQFVAPQKDDVDLPANAALELEVVAVDPDFALQRVKLSIVKGPQSVADKLLLDAVHRGQFVGRYLFDPAKLGLKPGDAVDYLAVAEDTKDGKPNRVETPRRRIRIVSADPQARGNDRVARNEPRDGGRQGSERGGPSEPSKTSPRDEAGRENESSADEPNADASRGGEQPKSAAGKKSSDPQEPSDEGEQQSGSEKGEAGKQQSSEGGDQQQAGESQQDPGDGKSGGEGQQGGDGQQGSGQQGAGKQGGKQSSGDQKSQGGESGNDQDGEGGDSGEGQAGAGGKGKSQDSKSQQGKSQGDKSDSEAGGSKQDGGESSGDQPVASDGSNDGDAIDQILKHRDAQQGERAGDNGQQGNQQQGNQQQGNQQQGNDQQGNEQQGNQAAGQEKQEQPSGGKPGEPTPDGATDPRAKSQPNDPGQKSAKPGDQQSPEGQTEKGAQSKPERGGSQGGTDQPGEQQSADDQAGGGDEKSSQGAGQQGKSPGKSQSQGDNQGQRGESSEEESGEPSADANGKPSGKQQGRPSDAGDAKQNPAGDEGQDEQQGQQPGSKPGTKGDKQSPSAKGEKSPTADKQSGAGADPKAAGEKETAAGEKETAAGEKESGAGDKPKGDPAAKSDPHAGDANENGSPDKSQPDGQSTKGQGAKSKSDPTKGSQTKSGAQQPDAKGGDGEHETGESGAGQKGGDKQGSPEAMESAKPKSKSPAASPDGEGKKSEEGQSGSRSQNESNSEGQDSGDQSGGGKQGGGQKANKPGTGGAGQNTAADEGAGVSDERGAGEDSERAGADRESQKPTGQSGDKAGQGSKTRPGEGADGKPGPEGGSESAEQKQPGAEGSSGESPGTPGGGTPRGGAPNGQAGDPQASGPWKPGEEVADKANLEYARKATDLALSHLKDELAKDNPDPNLLKRLGWTRGELEKFVERWEQMRDASKTAGEQGTAARRELDETLRSLGLRPRTTSLRATTTGDDKVRGMKESRRTTAPAEYAEQTKAYSQGTARGGK